jgi:hypothetical protein
MTLVNGYLAFKYITEEELTLREFTNSVALAMCAEVGEGGGGGGGGDARRAAGTHGCADGQS